MYVCIHIHTYICYKITYHSTNISAVPFSFSLDVIFNYFQEIFGMIYIVLSIREQGRIKNQSYENQVKGRDVSRQLPQVNCHSEA